MSALLLVSPLLSVCLPAVSQHVGGRVTLIWSGGNLRLLLNNRLSFGATHTRSKQAGAHTNTHLQVQLNVHPGPCRTHTQTHSYIQTDTLNLKWPINQKTPEVFRTCENKSAKRFCFLAVGYIRRCTPASLA